MTEPGRFFPIDSIQAYRTEANTRRACVQQFMNVHIRIAHWQIVVFRYLAKRKTGIERVVSTEGNLDPMTHGIFAIQRLDADA